MIERAEKQVALIHPVNLVNHVELSGRFYLNHSLWRKPYET